MKVLGSEIIDFFNSEWPEYQYVDDGELEISEGKITSIENGAEFPISEIYDLSLFGRLISTYGPEISLTKSFQNWKSSQTSSIMVIRIPKENKEKVLEILATFNVEIKRVD